MAPAGCTAFTPLAVELGNTDAGRLLEPQSQRLYLGRDAAVDDPLRGLKDCVARDVDGYAPDVQVRSNNTHRCRQVKTIEQPVQPKSDEPKSAGGLVTSTALSDDDLGRAAGGPAIYCVNISTITDLADEDLRQVAGGPRVYNE
jgi:hypothetical protein